MKYPLATFERLLWATACLGLALIPHIAALPPWISLAVVAAALIRLCLAWYGRGLPPAYLRLAISIVCIVLLLLHFHTFNGISAGTALLSLMAGLKLLEARTERDIHIIVFIVYFLSVTALLAGTSSLLLFYLLGVCWLTTAALARLTAAKPPPSWRASLRFSARVLLLAMPLALVLWLFFPRFSGPLWHLPAAESAALSGLSDSMSPGDLSELSLSSETAFRVRFAGATPPPNQRYWRGPVLFNFDGHTWTRSENSFVLAPKLHPQGQAYDYTLSVEPHRHNWLFALDWPARWDAPRTFLTSEYTLVQTDAVSRTVDVAVTSYARVSTDDALSVRMRRRDTRLPPDSNPRTQALAKTLRAQYPNDLDYAQAVLGMFRKEAFYYTLTPPRLAHDSVDEFLFDTKQGFCEHYASAFATLMRAAGIPARVVTGYQGGTFNRFAGYWIVRQSDAHAWNEIWIDGRGWLRADPTAAIAPERIEAGPDALYGDDASAAGWYRQPWLNDLRLRLDALQQLWRQSVLRFDQKSQMYMLKSLGIPSPDPYKLVAVLAFTLVLTVLWLSWQVRREFAARPRDRVARAFARLSRKLDRQGLGRLPSETALAFARRVSQKRPDLAAAMVALCTEYNQLRYGPDAAGPRDIARFTAAVRAFRP